MSSNPQPTVSGSLVEQVLRPMVAADVPAAQALTASFGWPHRTEDWLLMQSLGEGVVAERDGVLMGTALCWRFGDDWASLGMIAVAAALHGQGMGREMMRRLMALLPGRSLALHATAAGLKLYASFGFVPAGVVVQHQGVVARGDAAVRLDLGLRPVGAGDLASVVALDRCATGMDRAGLLGVLMEEPGGVVLDRGGEVAGFALVRRFGRGQIIGPVVAGRDEDARTMIGHLIGARAGEFVRVDVMEASGLGLWLSGFGLEQAGTVIRMVRGAAPGPSGAAQSFALASQAFG